MELGGGSRHAEALAGLTAAFNHYLAVLAGGGLEGEDHESFVGSLQGFEEFRNRLPLADHQLVEAATKRDLAGELGSAETSPGARAGAADLRGGGGPPGPGGGAAG